MIDAILFDLDGTLVDTERVAMTTGIAAFAVLGRDVTPDFMLGLVGVDLPTAATVISSALPGIDLKALDALWRERFVKAIDHELELKAGVIELLEARLRPMGVVTSSGRAEAHKKLVRTGLTGYFQTVVTLADVTAPKPAAEPYLLAAERLGVAPARCLVFEDSETGAEAAFRAGCKVVQVPDIAPVSGKWAHHVAADLIGGARLAGLIP